MSTTATLPTVSGPILEMRSITKEFPGVKALSDVCITVRAGEIHAICGENGAGKSTLMKVLSGVYPYGSYDGDILLYGEEQRYKDIAASEQAGIANNAFRVSRERVKAGDVGPIEQQRADVLRINAQVAADIARAVSLGRRGM